MINNVNSRKHVDSENAAKIPSGARIFSESTCFLEFTLFIYLFIYLFFILFFFSLPKII